MSNLPAPGASVKAAPPRRITRFLKRRREPGEIATPVVSIRNQCLECCGYQPSEVELCTAPQCWLFPYRFGCKPEAAARRGKNVGLEQQTAQQGFGKRRVGPPFSARQETIDRGQD